MSLALKHDFWKLVVGNGDTRAGRVSAALSQVKRQLKPSARERVWRMIMFGISFQSGLFESEQAIRVTTVDECFHLIGNIEGFDQLKLNRGFLFFSTIGPPTAIGSEQKPFAMLNHEPTRVFPIFGKRVRTAACREVCIQIRMVCEHAFASATGKLFPPVGAVGNEDAVGVRFESVFQMLEVGSILVLFVIHMKHHRQTHFRTGLVEAHVRGVVEHETGAVMLTESNRAILFFLF